MNRVKILFFLSIFGMFSVSLPARSCGCMSWHVQEEQRNEIIDRDVREILFDCVEGLQQAIVDFDELDRDVLVGRFAKYDYSKLSDFGPDSRELGQSYRDTLSDVQFDSLYKLIRNYYGLDGVIPADMVGKEQEFNKPQLVNPDSVRCQQIGGKLVGVFTVNAGQDHACLFPNNSWCMQGQLSDGECKSGDNSCSKDGHCLSKSSEYCYWKDYYAENCSDGFVKNKGS